MGFAMRRVDLDFFKIGRAQGVEDEFEITGVRPAREALVDGRPSAKALGQIPPWRSGFGDPKDGLDEFAVVVPAPPLGGRQDALDARPLSVGESVAGNGHEGLE